MDLSYTKMLTDEELEEDYELREYLLNELNKNVIHISKPYEEIPTGGLLTLYNVVNKYK